MRVGGYVVVTFGGPADGWCSLNHCPMEAFGPFTQAAEAEAKAQEMPEWTQPHILLLQPEETTDHAPD
jgi:hypothetical protein